MLVQQGFNHLAALFQPLTLAAMIVRVKQIKVFHNRALRKSVLFQNWAYVFARFRVGKASLMQHAVNPSSVIHDFTGKLSPGVIYHQSFYASVRFIANRT